MAVFSRRIYWLLVAMALALAACEGAEERERGHFQRGVEYFTAGDRDRALIEFRNAAQINPANAEAYYYIARVYEAKKLWPKAFFSYLKSVEHAPEHVDANVRLGRMYVLAGDYDEALARSEVAIAADAGNAGAVALRGAVYLRQEKFDEARQEAFRALDLDPASVSATSVLAAFYRAQDQDLKAIAVLQRGLELNPAEASLRVLKIALHIDRQEHAEAEADLRFLADSFPDISQYWISLAKLYLSWDRPGDAEAVLREAVAANPENDKTKLILIDFIENQKKLLKAAESELTAFIDAAPESIALRFGLAELYGRHDKREAAMGVLRDISTRDETGPQGIRAKVSLARLNLLAEDSSSARGLIEGVLGVEPRNPAALLLRAQMLFDDGSFRGAVTDLRTVLRGDPNSIAALVLLSQAYLREGGIELAINSLIRLVELRPDSFTMKLQLSQLLARKGDLEGALRYLNESIESSSLTIPWLTTKAELLIEMRRYAEAVRTAEEVKAVSRGEPIYWALIGKAAFAEGRFADAVGAFENARGLDPNSNLFLAGLVQAFERLERRDDAVKALEDYLADHPEDSDARLRLGDIYFKLEDFASAQEAYREFTKSDPGSSAGHLRLAGVYFRQDREDEAIEVLRQGVAAAPHNERLTLGLALNLQRLGRFEEAIATYEAFLEIEPRSVTAANNMAALVADHENGDLKALRRALVLVEPLQTSDNPQFLDTIGWLYYRAGEANQAITFLKRAIALAPKNLEINYHLGMAFLAEGQIAPAREHLEKALPEEGLELPFTEEVKKALSSAPDS